MTAAEAAARILDSLRRGAAVAEVVAVSSTLPAVRPGARLLVWEERVEGGSGDAEVDARATEMARQALLARRASAPELELVGGTCSLFVQPHAPADELLIVGAGHIARPLCRIGALLGFRVIVLDDRPEFATRERFPEAERVLRADFTDAFRDTPVGPGTFVVLVTRGHKYDFEALRRLLRSPAEPAYVGMVGSRRRVRAALEQLAREGVPVDRLRRIHAPIGLDLGGDTPEEIALAIAAEVVLVRRGGGGGSLRDRDRVVERWIGA